MHTYYSRTDANIWSMVPDPCDTRHGTTHDGSGSRRRALLHLLESYLGTVVLDTRVLDYSPPRLSTKWGSDSRFINSILALRMSACAFT